MVPCNVSKLLKVNNHHQSRDLVEERLANSLSVYYGEPVALAVLILSQEASKQLALSMVTYPLTASN